MPRFRYWLMFGDYSFLFLSGCITALNTVTPDVLVDERLPHPDQGLTAFRSSVDLLMTNRSC